MDIKAGLQPIENHSVFITRCHRLSKSIHNGSKNEDSFCFGLFVYHIIFHFFLLKVRFRQLQVILVFKAIKVNVYKVDLKITLLEDERFFANFTPVGTIDGKTYFAEGTFAGVRKLLPKSLNIVN